VCRSFVDGRFSGVTVVNGMETAANGMTPNGGVGDLSSVLGSSLSATDMSLQSFLLVGRARMFGNSLLLILRSTVLMSSSSPSSCFCIDAMLRDVSPWIKRKNEQRRRGWGHGNGGVWVCKSTFEQLG
jgi:hypothetical protein